MRYTAMLGFSRARWRRYLNAGHGHMTLVVEYRLCEVDGWVT